jgi:hypothetical protein
MGEASCRYKIAANFLCLLLASKKVKNREHNQQKRTPPIRIKPLSVRDLVRHMYI